MWGPVVKTEHEQSEDLKNRMLKNMKAIGVWILGIERDRNYQSGRFDSEISLQAGSLRAGAL